jgi:hypothetical protein
MTGSGTATISSTGQDIIRESATQFLAWDAGKPRLFNGDAANAAGATNFEFPTASLCRAWWNNYHVEAEKNGNGFVSIGDPVSGDAQTPYLNVFNTSMPGWGTAFQSGDVIKFRVSTAS